jgi:hypothetical protein
VRSVRESSVRLLQGILARGERVGAFEVADPFLVAAAIGAMGIRVAEWWEPGGEQTADEVADVYAALALKLVAK